MQITLICVTSIQEAIETFKRKDTEKEFRINCILFNRKSKLAKVFYEKF